jgi:hypothetical protein
LLSAVAAYSIVGMVGAAPLIFPVVPSDLEDVEGNTDAFPLSIGAPFSARYQQVYDASAFTLAIPPEGAWIDEVIFRVDGPRGFSFDLLLTNVQVSLSTTSRSPDGLSPVFDENIGADETIVTGPGQRLLAGAWSAPRDWPNGFSTGFHFATPYYYDPAQGNLLLDVRVIGGSIGGGYVSPLDATDLVGDPVSSVFAYDFTHPTTGTPGSVGLITLFTIQPIPEPSILALFGIGVSLLGWSKLKRKRGGY